jgi:hypothetical protein
MRNFLLCIVTCISLQSFGQFYPLEAGGVGGLSSGLSFRAYLDEELSYEALLSFRNEGAQLHLFRQNHSELHLMKDGSINLIYGFGSHLGFYISDTYNMFFQNVYFGRTVFSPVIGGDGFVAIEYRFHETPLSFGIQYKPFMELSYRQIFVVNLWDFGFTFKYRFKPDNSYY